MQLNDESGYKKMNYNETIQYLYDRLPVFHQIGAAAYKPGLDNSISMMAKLGNPHEKYKTIHVAGTNGKGSVSHFLSAVLQSAGYKTGLYTSPHLVDFGERVRLNGTKVNEEFVVDFVAKNKELFDEIQPSFFEATMALAFDYFAAEKVDVAIVEVGLGGRLDSTNIIIPELAIITNISLDHTQFLGNTLTNIASEKAGIIKENVPVVIGEATLETKAFFIQKAEELHAPISFAEDCVEVKFMKYDNGEMLVSSNRFGLLESGLSGVYQLKNIATLLESIRQLRECGFDISDDAVRAGIKYVVSLTGLQGRWQQVCDSPRVILDTGHNQAGIENVTRQLAQQKYNRLRIVFGMVEDKDPALVLSLLPKGAVYYFTAANSNRSLRPELLINRAAEFELQGCAFGSVKDAVNQAVEDAETDDLVFVGGSNFVVGEALELFDKKNK